MHVCDECLKYGRKKKNRNRIKNVKKTRLFLSRTKKRMEMYRRNKC